MFIDVRQSSRRIDVISDLQGRSPTYCLPTSILQLLRLDSIVPPAQPKSALVALRRNIRQTHRAPIGSRVVIPDQPVEKQGLPAEARATGWMEGLCFSSSASRCSTSPTPHLKSDDTDVSGSAPRFGRSARDHRPARVFPLLSCTRCASPRRHPRSLESSRGPNPRRSRQRRIVRPTGKVFRCQRSASPRGALPSEQPAGCVLEAKVRNLTLFVPHFHTNTRWFWECGERGTLILFMLYYFR
jgi:hypothetical protein